MPGNQHPLTKPSNTHDISALFHFTSHHKSGKLIRFFTPGREKVIGWTSRTPDVNKKNHTSLMKLFETYICALSLSTVIKINASFRALCYFPADTLSQQQRQNKVINQSHRQLSVLSPQEEADDKQVTIQRPYSTLSHNIIQFSQLNQVLMKHSCLSIICSVLTPSLSFKQEKGAEQRRSKHVPYLSPVKTDMMPF